MVFTWNSWRNDSTRSAGPCSTGMAHASCTLPSATRNGSIVIGSEPSAASYDDVGLPVFSEDGAHLTYPGKGCWSSDGDCRWRGTRPAVR